MKKLFALVATTLIATSWLKAGEPIENYGIFKHVSIGAGFGILDGIGFEAATPITDFVQLRLGYSFLPEIKYTADGFEYKDHQDVQKEAEADFKLNMKDFKLLFDIYPARRSAFHFTVGAYIGQDKLLTAEAKVPDIKPGEGLIIGDYTLGADSEDGIVRAAIKVDKFKPYVGFGFGHHVPRKRVNCSFDMGVQFWGNPGVYGRDVDTQEYHKITKEDIGEESADEYFDTMAKITVCPVISFRINGRIF